MLNGHLATQPQASTLFNGNVKDILFKYFQFVAISVYYQKH